MIVIQPGDYVLGFWAARGKVAPCGARNCPLEALGLGGKDVHYLACAVRRGKQWVTQVRLRSRGTEPDRDRKDFLGSALPAEGPDALGEASVLELQRQAARRTMGHLGAAAYEESLVRAVLSRETAKQFTEAFKMLSGSSTGKWNDDEGGWLVGRAKP